MCERFGTMKMLILNSLGEHLIELAKGLFNVNEKANVLNSTFLNVLSNFIPHEFVV